MAFKRKLNSGSGFKSGVYFVPFLQVMIIMLLTLIDLEPVAIRSFPSLHHLYTHLH